MNEKQILFNKFPDTYRSLLEKRAGIKNDYILSFKEGGYSSISTIDNLFKLAKCEFLLKNYDSALVHYKKGIECSKKIMGNNNIMILNARIIVGEICLLDNRPLESLKNAQIVLMTKPISMETRISALKLLSKTYDYLHDEAKRDRTAKSIERLEKKEKQ